MSVPKLVHTLSRYLTFIYILEELFKSAGKLFHGYRSGFLPFSLKFQVMNFFRLSNNEATDTNSQRKKFLKKALVPSL